MTFFSEKNTRFIHHQRFDKRFEKTRERRRESKPIETGERWTPPMIRLTKEEIRSSVEQKLN